MRRSALLLLACLASACGPHTPARPPDGTLSVIDFNLLHGVLNEDSQAEPFDRFSERLPQVARVLGERRPAVIILQETYLGWLTGYPDVRRTLKARLDAQGDDYQSAFASYLGGGVVFNGGAGVGQMTFTRWPIVTATRFAVPGGRRIVLHVRVDSGRERVDTYNVHLEGAREMAAQTAEMQSVLDFITTTAAPMSTVVLGGDLNSTDEEAASQLLRDAGFVDLGAAAGLACTSVESRGCTNSNLPLDEAGFRAKRRIDFIWLRSAQRAANTAAPIFDVPFELPQGGVLWASDHIGLAADL